MSDLSGWVPKKGSHLDESRSLAKGVAPFVRWAMRVLPRTSLGWAPQREDGPQSLRVRFPSRGEGTSAWPHASSGSGPRVVSSQMAFPALALVPIALLGVVALVRGGASKAKVFWPVRGGTKTVPVIGEGAFGASRDGGVRLHAGVDLPAPARAAIVAMVDGQIVSFPSGYVGLDAVAVREAERGVIYAEFTRDPKLRVGDFVKTGQVLGVAKASAYGSMLHVEFWQKASLPSAFTTWPKGSMTRPAGLIDPTSELQQIAKAS